MGMPKTCHMELTKVSKITLILRWFEEWVWQVKKLGDIQLPGRGRTRCPEPWMAVMCWETVGIWSDCSLRCRVGRRQAQCCWKGGLGRWECLRSHVQESGFYRKRNKEPWKPVWVGVGVEGIDLVVIRCHGVGMWRMACEVARVWGYDLKRSVCKHRLWT